MEESKSDKGVDDQTARMELAVQPYFVPGLAASAVRAAIEHADEVERRTGWVPQQPVPYLVKLLVSRDPNSLRATHPKYGHSLGLSEARLFASLRPPKSYPVGLLVTLLERERALALLRRTSVERVREAKRKLMRKLHNDWARARNILKRVSWGPAPEDVHEELREQGRAALGAPWGAALPAGARAAASGSNVGLGEGPAREGDRGKLQFSRLDRWAGPPGEEPLDRLKLAADEHAGASATFALAPESAAATSLGALRAHLDTRLGLKARRRSAVETDHKVLAQAAAMGILTGPEGKLPSLPAGRFPALLPARQAAHSGPMSGTGGRDSGDGEARGPGHHGHGGQQQHQQQQPYVRRRGSTAVPDVQTALRLRAMVATDVPSSDLSLGVRAKQGRAAGGAGNREGVTAAAAAAASSTEDDGLHPHGPAAGSYSGLAAGGGQTARSTAQSTARGDDRIGAHEASVEPCAMQLVPRSGGAAEARARAKDLSAATDVLLPPDVDLGLRGPLWQDCLYSDYAHRAPLQRLDFQGMTSYMTDPLLLRMLGQRGVLSSLRALLLAGCRKVTGPALLPVVFQAQQLVELDVRRCEGLGTGFFLGLLEDSPPAVAGAGTSRGTRLRGRRTARPAARLSPIKELTGHSKGKGDPSAAKPKTSVPRDRLKVLRAGGCTCVDGRVAARLCAELRGLEAIDLSRCPRITDKVLDALAGRPGAVGGVGEGGGGGGSKPKATAGWGQIEQVWLDHCKEFSEEGFMALASHAGSLKRLSLVGCRQLSGSAFAGLPAPVVRRRRVVVVSSRVLKKEGVLVDDDGAAAGMPAQGDEDQGTKGPVGKLVGVGDGLPSATDRPVVVALARHDPSAAREQDERP